MDKPLASLSKMRREKTHINNIRDQNGEITARKFRKSSVTTLKTCIKINLRAGGVSQVGECLSRKSQALSSNFSTSKNK
jgi:hypothetical protein